MIIDRLPFDVWVAISSHLAVESILQLGSSCKFLHEMMQDRSVWRLALEDILEVKPFRQMRSAIPRMSPRELKRAVLRAIQVENVLDKDVIYPLNMTPYKCSPSIDTIKVLPGGQLILIMEINGTLHLHHTGDLTSPIESVTRPDCADAREWRSLPTYILSTYSKGKALVFTSENYTNFNEEELARIRVYELDYDIPSIRFLQTITKPDSFIDYTCRGSRFAIGWETEGYYYLNIRKISLSNGECQEVIMNLGAGVASPSLITTMPCSHIIIVSIPQKLLLYTIPELESTCNGISPKVVDVTPLAVHEESDSTEVTGNEIWNSMCSHFAGDRLATAGVREGTGYDVIILPRANQPETTFVRHPIGTCHFGPTRIIWENMDYLVGNNTIELLNCAHSTRPDDNVGYMRMGRANAPDPSRANRILLSDQSGQLRDITWDEYSGLVFILLSFEGYESEGSEDGIGRSILVLDLLGGESLS